MLGLKKISNFAIALVTLFMSTAARADWTLNMPKGVTPVSREIYHLHMLIFWVCVAIAVVVFSVLIFSLIKYRKSRGAVAAEFHEHPVLEIIWAIIPFIILIAMAIPATRVLILMDNNEKSDLTIKVTGYQWKWEYTYLNQGIRFFSNLSTPIEQIHNKAPKDKWYLLEVDKPLIVPINKKIRFLVTSNDVNHSWWVPDFGIKRDAIPGFIHESWARIEKPGIYRGQCAELCGVNHAFMPIVVQAVSEEDFGKWLKLQEQEKAIAAAAALKDWSLEALMKEGEADYNKYCSACHKPNGLGQPPTYPALKGSSIAVGKPISRHLDVVMKGVTGTGMQGFAEQLSDTELAAIITYERNAWGNNTGDKVQPLDIKAYREKN